MGTLRLTTHSRREAGRLSDAVAPASVPSPSCYEQGHQAAWSEGSSRPSRLYARLTIDKVHVNPLSHNLGRMKPSIIERALELAAESQSVDEVRRKLKAEQYSQVAEHLSGKLIRSQIVERLQPNGKDRRVR